MSESRLDEQLVSQAVQAGVSSQVEAETLDVKVRTDLSKAVQGQVDSVQVSGRGIVAQDIRLEALELQTDSVAIDPLSALLGNLKLNQSVNATTRVTLTETDLNQTINADVVFRRIPPLQLDLAGEAVTIELQHPVELEIPSAGRIRLTGSVLLRQIKGTQSIQFSTVILPQTEMRPVLLESFHCQPGTGVTIDFTIVLMQKFQEILALPNLEVDGISFQIKNLDVQADNLTAETEVHIRQEVLF
jgi:hypothetical protein